MLTTPAFIPVQGLHLTLSDKSVHLFSQWAHLEGKEHVFVLEGEVTLLLEGQPLDVSTGDPLTVPRGALHALQNRHDGPSRLMIISQLESAAPYVLPPFILASDVAGAYD
jgi:mannose-6-phosphate isomerase-like protein (cupin superfamily)